jgi:hypothetical protein
MSRLPAGSPISLYILTDGKFGDKPPEFARPIEQLLERLRSITPDIKPDFLSVTIIQFGDDGSASRTLHQIFYQSIANLPLPPPL